MSRFTILLFFIFGLILVSSGRMLIRRMVTKARVNKLHLRRLAIFAADDKIRELKNRFNQHGTFGYEPIYLSHEEASDGSAPPGIDPVERRLRMIEDERIAEVVVIESPAHNQLLDALVPRLMASSVPVVYVPRSEALFLEANRLRDFMGFGAVSFGRQSNAVISGAKLAFDRLLAFLLMIMGLPLHLLQVIISSKGCVEEREMIGRRGARFGLKLYRDQHGPAAGLTFFRCYPALFNIMAGELSFVGLAPLTAEQWEATDESYQLNPPDARPGLVAEGQNTIEFCLGTGSSQRGGIELLKMIMAFNRRYVKTWSMSHDIRILLETIQEGKSEVVGEA